MEGFGLPEGGEFILDIVLEIQIELVPEGYVVPREVLLMRLELCRIIRYRGGLFEAAKLPLCCGFEVGVSVYSGKGMLERLPVPDVGGSQVASGVDRPHLDVWLEPVECRAFQPGARVQDFGPFILKLGGLTFEL